MKADIERAFGRLNCEPEVRALFEVLDGIGEFVLIGGAIRDWATGQLPRDIDVVVAGDAEALAEGIATLSPRRNRFGGWKLNVSGVELDLWALSNNWAHRRGLAPNGGLETLSETAFLNIDCGVYFPQSGKLLAQRLAVGLERRELALVLPSNPFPALCAARVLVTMQHYSLVPEESLRAWMRATLQDAAARDEFEAVQLAHYGAIRAPLGSWQAAVQGWVHSTVSEPTAGPQ